MGAPAGGELSIAAREGLRLSGERAGEGIPIVLLHGLTATRRYVVMGSRTLERSGHLVVSYDARGHGRSEPAPERGAYGYERLARDLEDVLDALELPRAVIAGASMGAHTALALALAAPERVAALGLITPGYDPDGRLERELERWDALADGLERGGIEGFIAAYDLSGVPVRWHETLLRVVRQRMAAHEHPLAVADALRAVPRSQPFRSFAQLADIDVPTSVIATRGEADPGHPLALAERYAQAIPPARLLVEEPGAPPLAWQGGRVSSALAQLAAQAGLARAGSDT